MNKGNKLSSVLDIRYKEPEENRYSVSAGFTGGQLAAFHKAKKFKALGGIRYLNNTLLVKKMEGDVEYRPSFADVQSLFILEPNAKTRHEWLTYLSFQQFTIYSLC